jgi:hypothetical protein
VNIKKPVLGMKETEHPPNIDTTRPKNPSAITIPTEGYVLEIDGKFKAEYATSEEAMKASLELKKKYPQIQVNVFDAKERTRTLVKGAEQVDASI